MKKDLGSLTALYPTPVVVVGAIVNGKPTYTLVAHMGIPQHDMIMVSLAKNHYINQGIRQNKALTVNVVDENWLEKAAYCGSVSGAKTDKSEVFAYTIGETGAPIIDDAKISMECIVEDIYETAAFDNFMLKISHTFADESILNESGNKPDYNLFKPVLFEMPNYTYLKTGEQLGKCLDFVKKK